MWHRRGASAHENTFLRPSGSCARGFTLVHKRRGSLAKRRDRSRQTRRSFAKLRPDRCARSDFFWQSAQLIEGGLEAVAKKKKRNTPRPKKGIPHVPRVPRVDRFYSIQLLVHYWILKNGSTRGTWGRWGRQNGWVPFMLAKPHRPSSVRAQLLFFGKVLK